MRHFFLTFAAGLAVLAGVGAATSSSDRPPAKAPLFALLPGGTGVGEGSANTAGFCSQFAGELAGNFFCKDGSGNVGIQLSAVGAPAAQTDAACPNGPNCGNVASTRTSAGNRLESAAAATGAGSALSYCALINQDVLSGTSQYVVHHPGVADIYVVNGQTVTEAYATGASGAVAAGTFAAGAWTFVCGTYDGTTTRTYVNGIADGTSTAAAGAIQDSVSAHAVGGLSGSSSNAFVGRVALALFTAKTLSAQTIAAMSSALLPSAQGALGEVVAVTRTSVRSCCSAAGCSIIPDKKACVTGGSRTVTNLLTRSEEMELAGPWFPDFCTVTANTAVAPTGTQTAETFTAFGSNADFAQTINTTNGVTYTASIWLKVPSGTLTLPIYLIENGAGAWNGNQTVTLNSGWQLFSVTGTANTTSSARLQVGGSNAWNAGQVIHAWGGQITASSTALPYCPTGATNPQCTVGTGQSGVDVEFDTTNVAFRSSEFDDAAWTKSSDGVTAVPVVTANAAIAPDGTLTADQIAFPLVSGASKFSNVAQSRTSTAAPYSGAVWLKTASGTATVYLAMTPNGVSYSSTRCLVSTTWTRCTLENVTQTAALWFLQVGVDLRDAAQSTQGAQTLYAWGMQLTATSYAQSYCPTAATSASCWQDQVKLDTGVKNLFLQTDTLDNASWTKRGTASVVANQSAGPDGANTADRVTVGAIFSDDFYQVINSLPAGAPIYPRFCIRRVSTSGTVIFQHPAGSTNGLWIVDLAALGPGLRCITGPDPSIGVVQNTPWTVDNYSGGLGGFQIYSGGGSVTFDLSAVQQTVGTLGPYCQSVASQGVCTTWPAATGSICARYAPREPIGTYDFLVDTGNATNTGWAFGRHPSGALLMKLTNGAAQQDNVSSALTWNIGQSYKMCASWTGGSTVNFTRDGIAVGSTSSAFTVPSLQPWAWIGNYGGGNFAEGLISVDCLSKDPEGCR